MIAVIKQKRVRLATVDFGRSASVCPGYVLSREGGLRMLSATVLAVRERSCAIRWARRRLLVFSFFLFFFSLVTLEYDTIMMMTTTCNDGISGYEIWTEFRVRTCLFFKRFLCLCVPVLSC